MLQLIQWHAPILVVVTDKTNLANIFELEHMACARTHNALGAVLEKMAYRRYRENRSIADYS